MCPKYFIFFIQFLSQKHDNKVAIFIYLYKKIYFSFLAQIKLKKKTLFENKINLKSQAMSSLREPETCFAWRWFSFWSIYLFIISNSIQFRKFCLLYKLYERKKSRSNFPNLCIQCWNIYFTTFPKIFTHFSIQHCLHCPYNTIYNLILYLNLAWRQDMTTN